MATPNFTASEGKERGIGGTVIARRVFTPKPALSEIEGKQSPTDQEIASSLTPFSPRNDSICLLNVIWNNNCSKNMRGLVHMPHSLAMTASKTIML